MGEAGERWLGRLAWAGLAVLAAALVLQRIQPGDYFWHLATGERIAATGAVPRTDAYSYSAPGARWIDIHWLFQLGIHGLYRLGGHAAVLLGELAGVLGVLALLAPIGARRERPFLGVAALGLLLVAGCDRLQPRPEPVSWLLLAATVRALDRFERRGDAWVYALVPLQALWVNVHGLFALGPALAAMHLVGELARGLGGEPLRRGRVRRLAAATALATLACLANPNGLEGALYPLRQLAMIGPAAGREFPGIAELQPSLASLPGPQLAALALLAALSGAALAAGWRRLPLGDVLAWVAFLYLALGARRNAAVFAVVAAPLLVREANAWLDRRPPPRWLATGASALVCIALAALAWDAASGRFFPRLGKLREPGLGLDALALPDRAVDWIERERPAGPIAHALPDGGYLVWRLHPRYRVLLDGRLEVYGPERLRALALGGPARFEALDGEHHFGCVLLHWMAPGGAELLAHLGASAGWRLVSLEDGAALFVRAPPGAAAPPALDLDAAALLPPVAPEEGARGAFRLRSRAVLLSALGHDDRARAVLREALARFPRMEDAAALRAALRRPPGPAPR